MTKLDNCLGKIEEIDAYSFTWKHQESNQGLQYGLNADEVQSLNEGIVKVDSDSGFKSVNYNAVVGLLLGAIKELKEEVAQLKSA